MATKIVPSEAAPAEKVHYTFAGVEFDLGGSSKKDQAYESDDPVLLASADAHPWLTVERDQADLVQGEYVPLLAPEDDVLAGVNSKANDPEAVRAYQEEQRAATSQPVAIEAGLDQTEAVTVGNVAETVAAADADTTDTKKGK